MYKRIKPKNSTIKSVEKTEGETIETKIERILNNKEPITDGAPQIFTERKDGVVAAYNIRTDRFEIACEAMDKVSASITAKREGKAIVPKEEEIKKEKENTKVIKIDEVKSIQGSAEKGGN